MSTYSYKGVEKYNQNPADRAKNHWSILGNSVHVHVLHKDELALLVQQWPMQISRIRYIL